MKNIEYINKFHNHSKLCKYEQILKYVSVFKNLCVNSYKNIHINRNVFLRCGLVWVVVKVFFLFLKAVIWF